MKQNFWVAFEGNDKSGFEIEIPELGLKTECDSFEDLIDTACDCICVTLLSYEDTDTNVEFKEFNFDSLKDGQKATLIQVDLDKYKKEFCYKSKPVTLTIPLELYNKCKSLGINKSKVLQDALRKIIKEKE